MGISCKRGFVLFFFSLFLTATLPSTHAVAQDDDAYVSYNDFYDNLAPYGQWIEDPRYGYVWLPDEDANFRPYYTNGYWRMTEYGNTWVSDYPWGWACFHYGRWTYDPYYGWLWIPGNNWGPAWVSWRWNDNYFGWAPLGPEYEFGNQYVDYYCPNDWWVFIPPQYIYTGNYYRYWYGPNGNTRIIANTTFINNTYITNNVTFVGGPQVKQVEDLTHTPVQVHRVVRSRNLNTRVHNNTIRMFRPNEIRPVAQTDGSRSVPPNVVRAPQAVRGSQSVNTGQALPRTFHDDVPRQAPTRNDQIGTNINSTAVPTRPAPRTQTQPYEWDVHNSQPQPHRSEPAAQQPPRTQPQPQPQQPRPQPQTQQPQQRPQPQPQQSQPQPNQQRPAGRR